MFETHNSGRLVSPLGLYDDDSYLWSYALLRLHVPWFYMIYKTDIDEDGYKRDIALLSNISDLIDANNHDIQIDKVYLMSPAHLNKSDDWMMEPIKEILSGTVPKHNQIGNVFILENGNRYVDATTINKEEELINIRSIFKTRSA